MADGDTGMDFSGPGEGDGGLGAPMQEDFEEDVNFENDIELNDDFGRGRGRGTSFGQSGQPRAPWNGPPGQVPRGEAPRFRGRGFGPGGPPSSQFRGQRPSGPGQSQPMFGRGMPPRTQGPPGGNGPPGGGFGGPPNFNGPPGSWGGPPNSGNAPNMMMQPGPNGPPFSGPPGPGMMGAPPNMNSGPPQMNAGGGQPMGQFPPGGNALDSNGEIWVETKTGEGKSYFYNARTRESTWTKPEGPNVKVISQDQVEAMAQAATSVLAQNTSTAAQAALAQANVTNKTEDSEEAKKMEVVQGGPNAQMPPNMMSGPPPGMPPFVGPGGQFAAPPFGMPPPGFQGSWAGGPGAPGWPGAPAAPPWAMPPGMITGMPGAMAAIDEAAVMSKIDPEIIARASDWTEHKAPDNRFYYYNAKKGESVWEKPQAMKDLETAKLAAAQGISTRPSLDQPMPILASDAGKPQISTTNGDAGKDAADKDGEKFKKTTEDVKKKKDDEDKAKDVKSQDKSRPISSTPVPGTPWCVVWTGDGRVFFYNPSSRTSVWERPDELLKRTDVDKMVANPPDTLSTTNKLEEAKSPGKAKRASDESESEPEETPSKKPKKEDIPPPSNGASTPNNPTKKIDIGKEAAIEAEVRAAKERAVIPLETRIKLFKEMLSEKQVSAFSTWEKELHKIVFDSRYLLLTSKERKQVFERYVKERAEEERREKRNKLREKKDAFRKLLSESHLHGKSSFSDFAQKYAKDERFKGVEKMRERESLFNEYLIEVRKKEKDEKNQRREQTRKDFIAMLREQTDVDRHSHWSDVKRKVDSDARYKAVDSNGQREDWFREYCKMLKEEKKKAKEKDREHKREKEKHKKNKDKDKDKERHSKDKTEKDKKEKDEVEVETEAVSSEKEGEEAEPEVTETEDDKVLEQKEKDRQARAEASLKEREKEVQRTLATHMRDRDKEREQHKRDEAIQHFNALLADLVRNPDLSWREVKRILRKDHRWDLDNTLTREGKEKLFNEHIETLLRKKREKFRELLDETTQVSLVSSWKEIKKLIRDDPRYTKFTSSERCEREFKDYLKDKLITAKGHFKELLQETKLITHKSLATLRENQGHMQEIEDILKNDKRYLILEHIPQERTQLVLNYLEELDRRGPPPPITACEPNRRSNK